MIKDTDKEDREKALKSSWETAEPGRAEKAAKSRRRFMLLKKQKAGEEISEEDIEFLKEKRDRVKKKDLEDAAPVSKGKGKDAKGKPAPKGKNAPPPEKTEE